MTVKDVARALCVSISTVYRRIKAGIIKAVKRNRRWDVEMPRGSISMDWNDQVDKNAAMQDGRVPEDFQWDQWPVSNLILRHPISNKSDVSMICLCDMPIDTPQPNQYVLVEPGTGDFGKDREYNKVPDPIGMALSWVEYRLYDADSGYEIAEGVGGLHDGQSRCGFSPGDLTSLWDRLVPGGGGVRVCVAALPSFMFLSEQGAGMLSYSNRSNGYFVGEEIGSPVYVVSLDEHGDLLIDGYAREVSGDPLPTPDEIAEREWSDRVMREGREEYERGERKIREDVARENREHNERIERERREEAEIRRREREEADRRIERQRKERQAEDERAAAERKRLGISDGGAVSKKLDDPPSEDRTYLALVNLWHGQYDPDESGFRDRLIDLRQDSSLTAAVDEIFRRLGWVL